MTVATHHSVESIQFQVGLVRVNGHVSASAGAAADHPTADTRTQMMVVIGADRTFEWEASRSRYRAAGYRLLRVALEELRERIELIGRRDHELEWSDSHIIL